MTQENQEKAKGCFSRLAVLFGLFWLVAVGVVAFTQINSGGSGFEFTGSFLPILVFFAVFSLIRRRAVQTRTGQTRSRPETPASTPAEPKQTTISTPPIIPGRSKSTPPRTSPPPVVVSRPTPYVPEPAKPLTPDTVPDDEVDLAELKALEALKTGDLETPKPLSSEERLKQAREKYLKKP
jgi:hypothetical protein